MLQNRNMKRKGMGEYSKSNISKSERFLNPGVYCSVK